MIPSNYYLNIAHVLKEVREDYEYASGHTILTAIEDGLVDMLELDNSDFNEGRFRDAANTE